MVFVILDRLHRFQGFQCFQGFQGWLDTLPQQTSSHTNTQTARRRRRFLENAFLDVPDEQILHINNKDLLPSNS